jgi:hypothetical protein
VSVPRTLKESLKRLRERIRACTGRNRVGVKNIREVIADLNPLLRGWANLKGGWGNGPPGHRAPDCQ